MNIEVWPLPNPHGPNMALKSEDINTFNKWFIGCRGEELVLMNPPHTLTKADALLLAAWLVTLADLGGEDFPAYLEAVRNT